MFTECRAAKRVERVSGVAQRCARLGDPTLAAQRLPVSKQRSGALEGPAAEVGAQCLLEKSGGLLVVGEQCSGVPQTQRDPDSRVVPSARFDLRHARSCLIEAADMQGGLGKVSDDPGGNRRMV